MAIKPDTKYNGTVAKGSMLYESQTGTMGYQVNLTCQDGQTSFTIWLTANNKERAAKAFASLGVNEEDLKDPNYFEYQLGQDIEGREVSFGTREEEYKGKRSVKVAWIGKKSESIGGNLSTSAARLFGGKAEVQHEGKPAITDEDIPF